MWGGALTGALVPQCKMEIRSQLVRVGSLLRSCRSQESNLGPRDQQQASLPTEQHWQPPIFQMLMKYFRALWILYLAIFNFQNFNCLFLESVSYYLNEFWTKHLKKNLKLWLSQYPAGSAYIDICSLTFSLYTVCSLFSPALGKTLKFVFFPLTALSSCTAALVVNSNKN